MEERNQYFIKIRDFPFSSFPKPILHYVKLYQQELKEAQYLSVCPSVRPSQSALEHSIFIFQQVFKQSSRGLQGANGLEAVLKQTSSDLQEVF